MPERGYWQRLRAGKEVTRVPLPAESKLETYTSSVAVSPPPEHQSPGDDVWLASMLETDRSDGGRITCPIPPERWHPLLAPILEEMGSEAASDRKASKRPANPANTTDEKPTVPPWHGRGNVLRFTFRASSLRLTPLTYERGLSIANALLQAAEERGCVVSHDLKRGRFALELEGATLFFAIRERQDVVLQRGERRHVPTDKLAVVLELAGTSNSYELRDRSDEQVQDRLVEVFPRLYGAVIGSRERARAKAAQEAKSAKYWAWHAELEERRKAETAANTLVETNKAELVKQAERFARAEQIRSLVHAVRSRSTQHMTSSDSLIDWQIRALAIADEMDPIDAIMQASSSMPSPDTRSLHDQKENRDQDQAGAPF